LARAESGQSVDDWALAEGVENVEEVELAGFEVDSLPHSPQPS
jgi:hypothetical protein